MSRRLLGVLITVLLLGCGSGALAGAGVAMGAHCPPPGAAAVAAVGSATAPAAESSPCASGDRCLPARAEAADPVPLPAPDRVRDAGLPDVGGPGPAMSAQAADRDAVRSYALGVIRT